MADAKKDANRVSTGLAVTNDSNLTPDLLRTDAVTHRLLVNATITGGAGDGTILDGVDTDIKATVLDLTNSNPLTVAITDASGSQITSFGGGTQYSDGDANADPTGTVAMGTDGSNIFALATDSSGNLQVDILNASIPVTGTFRQATQPISGTVTANLSATDNAVLDAIAVDTGTIAGDTTSIDSKIPILGQALAAASVPVVLTAAQISTLTPLATVAVTQSGTWDEVGINNSGNSITVDGTVTTNMGTVTADPFGANADAASATGSISAKLRFIAATGIPITTLPGTGVEDAGETAGGTLLMMGVVRRDTLASSSGTTGDNSTVNTDALGALWVDPQGNVAHDAADSGSPVKIGLKAETSPKGITVVADGDRTDAYADADGLQMVKINTSGADLVSEQVSNTNGTSTAFSNFSAVANTYNYVTAIAVYNASATAGYVDFRDGTAGSIKWTMPLPAGGGAVLSSATPLFKTSANTALAFDVSGALTTVYISVSGFQSKV